MSDAPRFSVIIAAHNEEAYVGGAITSVLRQTESDWEAIVIDDGSTDSTADVVRGYAESDRRLQLISQPNRGLSTSLNRGIELSSAPYISLLDADDLWMPEYLTRMGAALDAAPDAGFAYTDAWWMDADSGRFNRALAMDPWNPPPEPPDDPIEMLRLVISDNFIFGLTTIRRETIERVGPFDTSLHSAEDYELWMRMLARGYRAVKPAGVLAIKRVRRTSMSTNHLTMLASLHEVCERVSADETLPDDVREIARARAAWAVRMDRAISGEDRRGAMRIAVRRRLGALRNRLIGPMRWRRRAPGEVRSAFPDLKSL